MSQVPTLNSDNPLVSDWWLRTVAIATQSHGLKGGDAG